MLKIYGIHGKTTAQIRIPAGDGKAFLLCEFTKGRPISGAGYKPATYATSDKTEQSIIENSPYFNKLVRLVETYGSDEKEAGAKSAKKQEASKEAAVSNEPRVYEDVATYEDAIKVLKALGAKATQLKSPEAAKKAMATMNISFPNYNFE